MGPLGREPDSDSKSGALPRAEDCWRSLELQGGRLCDRQQGGSVQGHRRGDLGGGAWLDGGQAWSKGLQDLCIQQWESLK